MSNFTKALEVSPLSDGKSWVLLKDFEYHVGSEDSDDCVIASKGFVTDFASVPRVFWFIIPKWGKYGNAAVIHDWLYWEQGNKNREQADKILLEAMEVLNVSVWKREIIYRSVRLFGWIAWFRNSADKKDDFNRVIKIDIIKATLSSKRPGALKNILKYYNFID